MGDMWVSDELGNWRHVGKVEADGISFATTEFNVDARQTPAESMSFDFDSPLRPLDVKTEYKITVPIDKINIDALRTIFGMETMPVTSPTTRPPGYSSFARGGYHVPHPHDYAREHIHWAMPTSAQPGAGKSFKAFDELLAALKTGRKTEIMNDDDIKTPIDEDTQTAIDEFDALEPADDGTVISWVYERRKNVNAYYFDTETFEYVAIRAAGSWYPTGAIGNRRFGGMTWRELGAVGPQTEAIRNGDFHIVTGWTHRTDI